MSRSILHVSDVHFGSDHARARAKTLIAVIETIHPDVVVVSGDLTQRARSAQFGEARAFLDEIRVPRVVVPGNHDVPLWNVAKRFVSPLSKWRRWMRMEPTSLYVDREVAILGIDTTRRFGIKGGLVGSNEIREVEEQLGDVPEHACRVVVGHHPLATLSRAAGGDSAMGGRRALTRLAALGVELVLSGHLHETHVFHPVDRSTGVAGGVLLVSAGTATSHRGRRTEAHANSFNVITVEARRIGVTTYLHTQRGETFVAGELTWFPRTRVARTRAASVRATP